jgi:predicted PhzF superfamily epimerase YddE/YHI9
VTPDGFIMTVFAGEGRRGNATGLAILGHALPQTECQRLATALGLPDSGFLFRQPDSDHWQLASFSPVEPLAVCFQTLLASAFVLRSQGKAKMPVQVRASPGSRYFLVSDQPGDPSLLWVRLRRTDGTAHPAPQSAFEYLNVKDVEAPPVIVDMGRARIVLEVGRERLFAFRQDPDAVMSFCRHAEVSGICLFARGDRGEIDARVFTTSLEGREDCGTGGAIASIALYLSYTGKAGDVMAAVKVRQGHGREGFGGLMMLKADRDDVWLGGRVEPIMHGHFALIDEGRRE